MKPVKLPYPISFQELLKLSVQPKLAESATRYGENEGPAITKRPDETPVEAARRRLEMEYPNEHFNKVEVREYSKGWGVEFWERGGITVFVEDPTTT